MGEFFISVFTAVAAAILGDRFRKRIETAAQPDQKIDDRGAHESEHELLRDIRNSLRDAATSEKRENSGINRYVYTDNLWKDPNSHMIPKNGRLHRKVFSPVSINIVAWTNAGRALIPLQANSIQTLDFDDSARFGLDTADTVEPRPVVVYLEDA